MLKKLLPNKTNNCLNQELRFMLHDKNIFPIKLPYLNNKNSCSSLVLITHIVEFRSSTIVCLTSTFAATTAITKSIFAVMSFFMLSILSWLALNELSLIKYNYCYYILNQINKVLNRKNKKLRGHFSASKKKERSY